MGEISSDGVLKAWLRNQKYRNRPINKIIKVISSKSTKIKLREKLHKLRGINSCFGTNELVTVKYKRMKIKLVNKI
jgi:butyrate kinase